MIMMVSIVFIFARAIVLSGQRLNMGEWKKLLFGEVYDRISSDIISQITSKPNIE